MPFTPNLLKTNWNYPTSISFGIGRIKELPFACKKLNLKRPLLVTDPGLAKLPMITAAIKLNQSEGIQTGLFSKVKSNPINQNIQDGVSFYKEGSFDGIIAWGGGSGIDAAKAIALMVSQSRPIWDFEDTDENWLRANITKIPKIVAVPTTSGTGSEVGRASVITNEESSIKKVIFHPNMLPSIVICDPELVTGLPSNLTAYTGMDALIHCFEAYCAIGYHPMAEGIALEGMKLVANWLPKAFKDGQDIEARAHMMSAAAMGATAFQKGLGAIHSLSHPMSAVYDTHHGLANAVFMPYVITFNKSAIKEKLKVISNHLSLKSPGYIGVIDWVLELCDTFNIPNNSEKLGARPEDLDKLAIMAANDPTASGNPVPVGPEEMRNLYQRAFKGFI